MALVIISGFPCSGKTTRVHEIKEMLEDKYKEAHPQLPRKDITIVNDELIGSPRSAYDDSKTEKVARANLLSHTIRKLSKEHVVICDGMNYIKGFRYQLYCAAREAGVRLCTVHIANSQANCVANNSALPSDSRYSEETIQNLFNRYEEPNSSVQWDSPLIVFPWCDSLVLSDESGTPSDSSAFRGLAYKLEGLRVLGEHGEPQDPSTHSAAHGSTIPKDAASRPSASSAGLLGSSKMGHQRWSHIAEEIWRAITKGDLKPVHAAVQTATPTSTNFLHILETTTVSILTSLLSAVNNSSTRYGAISFPCVLPNSGKSCVFSINIPVGKTVNIAALQRLKRQYTTMHKQANAAGKGNSAKDEDEIAHSFVKYVQGAI